MKEKDPEARGLRIKIEKSQKRRKIKIKFCATYIKSWQSRFL